MKRRIDRRLYRLFCALLLPALAAAQGSLAYGQTAHPAPRPPGLTLTTTAFQDGGIIPDKYTMNAESAAVSPALQWSHVPPGTVSFALVMHDPDTSLHKTSEEVLHWMIFNIPGTATGLPEGVPNTPQLPDGAIQVLNTGHKFGYMGPGAGPAGPYHHYTFELYALDTKLDLTSDATLPQLLSAVDGHVLGKGVLEGRFHR